MTKKDDRILAEVGEAAEDCELPEVLPETVEVSRPNLGHATVVFVRLSSGEIESLSRAAEAAHLPVSTVIRVESLTHVVASDKDALAGVTQRLDHLEKTVFGRSA